MATSSPMPEPAGYLSGHLLIAMPGMQDPRFDHTVVCLCAHSSDGAMGLIVNRPLAGMAFDDLLRQLELEPVPPQRRIRMVAGGPVESGRGFVLHSDEWSTEGTLPVMPGLALTASVEILKAVASGGGPRDCVLALGYAGWAPGQLEDEIQRNAWLSVPADGALVFRDDAGTTWEAALAKLRVDPALLSGSAGHA
ncbi:YqgE/AlgH family protein [Roseomonas sp. HF4]|uniref:YqgE/AlgH family protein n=1 Tax=Roseomonas sp. HF4 TaxID=2562313 RepID=UPI001F0F3DF9|nr:YqgE/AlgH family protein [Roseomonas sp. HF4]